MLKGRLEDDRMLTGRGKYVSDWNLPGQAYGHFVRSDRAHADIVALDAAAALAHPGVIAVITGEDIRAALKSLPCALPLEGRVRESRAHDRTRSRHLARRRQSDGAARLSRALAQCERAISSLYLHAG